MEQTTNTQDEIDWSYKYYVEGRSQTQEMHTAWAIYMRFKNRKNEIYNDKN